MCITDYLIGRHIRSSMQAFTIGGAGLSVPRNPQRVALTVSIVGPAAIGTGACFITCEGQNVGQLTANVPWRHITLQANGDLVTKAFTVSQVTGNPTGVWISYELPEDILAIDFRKFMSEYYRTLMR